MTGSETKKARYREFCAEENDLSIFLRDWWLDAVCGPDGWGVTLSENGGAVWGALPYWSRSRMGLKILGQPPFTPRLGPWIKYPPDQKYESRLSHEKSVITELVEGLPTFARFRQKCHPELTNWLPFYWQGFSGRSFITYRLPDLSDHDVLWKGLRSNIRREIRKARDRYSIEIEVGGDVDEVVELSEMTFSRQGESLPYTRCLARRVAAACMRRNRGEAFLARDPEGRAHAALYLVWDENVAYYLFGGGDPGLRNSGATSLCMWKAIEHAMSVSTAFDFEGSMVEPIERFFRGFGAKQVPYLEISKTPSLLVRMKEAVTALRGRN